MSEYITDIKEWEQKFPFLERVWTPYKTFDKNVQYEKDINDFLRIKNLEEMCVDLSEYKDFCKKLIRNLVYFSLESEFNTPSYDGCNMLYNWTYNSVEKNKITEEFINKCFEKYNNYMDQIDNPRICENFSKYKIYEPIIITILDIFIYNMPKIIGMLIEENDPISPSHKFVCECLKIYKRMNETYCLKNGQEREKEQTTCSKLEQLRDIYCFLSRTVGELNSYIRSLDNIDEELLVKCPEKENVHSPTKKAITATIGTFASASLPLAFLYKFTPLGSWINTKILRKDKLLDNMKKNEQEFLSNSASTRDKNSGDTIYRIKYNSALNE